MLANLQPAEIGEITRLLDQWQDGDREAEAALFTALYNALYAIAVRCVRTESPGGSMGPTALVHEAYLRLVHTTNLSVNNRAHFLSLTSKVMRHILVDRARARRAARRNGVMVSEEWIDIIPTDRDADQILAVDRAMDALSLEFPEGSRIIELRWFAGYSEEECADILSISTRTVRRRWLRARARLKALIEGASPESEQ